MTRKQLKKAARINMQHFLETYFCFENEGTLNILLKLSHCEIKDVAELYGVRLSKMPFEVLTQDMLARGDVILVEDIHGNVAPYINPYRRPENEFETTMEEVYTSYEVLEEEKENDKHKGRQKIKHFKS